MYYTRLPFRPERAQEIVDFAKEKPWHQEWPRELLRRFLVDLNSGPDFVFDLFDENKRVAAGVLLDRLHNSGNNAPLEILRIDGTDSPARFSQILGLAKDQLPQNRSGIEVALPIDLPNRTSLLSVHRLELYYQTFDMWNEGFSFSVNSPKEISLFQNGYPELYELMVDSFRDNVETAIPPFEEWKAARERATHSIVWVWKEEGRMIGFLILSLSENTTPDLHMVGVLKAKRGHGIGEKLIQTALSELSRRSISQCKLTVAVKNEKALGLYRKLGFREIGSQQTYVWKRK